jgi:hypothetical protein
VIVAQSAAAACLRHLKHFDVKPRTFRSSTFTATHLIFLIGFAPLLPFPLHLIFNATVTSSHNQEQENSSLIPIPEHEDWKKLCQSTPLILKLSLGIFPQTPPHTANCQGQLNSLRFDGICMQELTACF